MRRRWSRPPPPRPAPAAEIQYRFRGHLDGPLGVCHRDVGAAQHCDGDEEPGHGSDGGQEQADADDRPLQAVWQQAPDQRLGLAPLHPAGSRQPCLGVGRAEDRQQVTLQARRRRRASGLQAIDGPVAIGPLTDGHRRGPGSPRWPPGWPPPPSAGRPAAPRQPDHHQQQHRAVDEGRRGREEVVVRLGDELAHLVDEQAHADARGDRREHERAPAHEQLQQQRRHDQQQSAPEHVRHVEPAATDLGVAAQVQVDARGHHGDRERDDGQEQVARAAVAADPDQRAQLHRPSPLVGTRCYMRAPRRPGTRVAYASGDASTRPANRSADGAPVFRRGARGPLGSGASAPEDLADVVREDEAGPGHDGREDGLEPELPQTRTSADDGQEQHGRAAAAARSAAAGTPPR